MDKPFMPPYAATDNRDSATPTITRTALITARAFARDAVEQIRVDLGLVEHSELCRRLNLSHWACDGSCTTSGVPHCEEHGLPVARCAYCVADLAVA